MQTCWRGQAMIWVIWVILIAGNYQNAQSFALCEPGQVVSVIDRLQHVILCSVLSKYLHGWQCHKCQNIQVNISICCTLCRVDSYPPKVLPCVATFLTKYWAMTYEWGDREERLTSAESGFELRSGRKRFGWLTSCSPSRLKMRVRKLQNKMWDTQWLCSLVIKFEVAEDVTD